MKYSFIAPRRKSVFSGELILVLIFFLVSVSMLVVTYSFLVFKDYKFIENKQFALSEISDFNNSRLDMKDKIAKLKEEKLFGETIYTKNSVLRDSIANLFDLVPSQITLSEAKLFHNGLILYGITPNQDIYNFMLQAPLKSIFTTTYSSFFPAKNGWLQFVSTNYLDEANIDEGERKDEE